MPRSEAASKTRAGRTFVSRDAHMYTFVKGQVLPKPQTKMAPFFLVPVFCLDGPLVFVAHDRGVVT